MVEAKLHHWDFERSRWDSIPKANTFSIGIFQWLRKSSGNGLKKSKTLRVTGYTADHAAVYAKVIEICQKLNESKAHVESLPHWVQKHYSMTKPKNLAIPRGSSQLTGREVRTLRQQLMKQLLLPAGFVQSHASTYVRHLSELAQVINFQTRTWGGEFTVNLGLHYTFTPPIKQRRRIRWTQLDVHDCSIGGRIGFCLPRKLDAWFPFGTDPTALKEKLAYCANQSVAILDRYSRVLKDPKVLMSKSRNVIAPFYVSYPRVFFASVEMRLGLYEAAKRRLTAPILPEHKYEYIPRHRQLLRRLAKIPANAHDDSYNAKWLEWITA